MVLYALQQEWLQDRELLEALIERYGFDVADETIRSPVSRAPLGYWHQLSKEQRVLLRGLEEQRDSGLSAAENECETIPEDPCEHVAHVTPEAQLQ